MGLYSSVTCLHRSFPSRPLLALVGTFSLLVHTWVGLYLSDPCWNWSPCRSAFTWACTLPVRTSAHLNFPPLCLHAPDTPGLPPCHFWIPLIHVFVTHEYPWSSPIPSQFHHSLLLGGHSTPQVLVTVNLGNLVGYLFQSYASSVIPAWISTLWWVYNLPQQPFRCSSHYTLIPEATRAKRLPFSCRSGLPWMLHSMVQVQSLWLHQCTRNRDQELLC